MDEEAVEVDYEGDPRTFWWLVCGECHSVVGTNDERCKQCGRKIKFA